MQSSALRLLRSAGLHRGDVSPRQWVDDAGEPVTDEATLERLRTLAVPPGWREVWASRDPEARVQATGIDSRGRTQYRYSASAEDEAATHKFGDLLLFGSTLPTLRTQVDRHLSSPSSDTPADRVKRVTAAVVRLLDRGLFRVGSERYVRDNHTYGLTTLTPGHVQIAGDRIEFSFIGKEHRPWHVTLEDPQAAQVIGSLLSEAAASDSPLFSVETPEGPHVITSSVVNSYIHGATTAPATAKTFRTWGATAAATAVAAGASPSVPSRSKRPDLIAFEVAAQLLGDTREVARRSYVHPHALEAGRAPAVVTAVAEGVESTGSNDVQAVLRVDSVVVAIAEELRRLSPAGS